MPQVSFKVSDADSSLIHRIVKRALAVELVAKRNAINLEMSITACHANGTPLDLEKLLDFDAFNFAHDVFGIDRNTSRDTGKLLNCFLPRCARQAKAAA
jgi:hypothetical protein